MNDYPTSYDETENPDIPEVPDVPETPDPPPEEPPAPKPITNSILLTTKKLLGISEEYKPFDIDILASINGVMFKLNQLGVGPDRPFVISSDKETWDDFLGENLDLLTAVKSYIYMRVRLIFDPPTNSFLVDSFEKQCQEMEWRFTVQPKNQKEVDAVNTWRMDIPTNPNYIPKLEEPPKEEESKPETQPMHKTKHRDPNNLFDIFR